MIVDKLEVYGMTDKEITEKAIAKSLQYNTKYSEDFDLKKFLDNPGKGIQIDRLFHLLREKAYRDGYIAGAKDNFSQWHDLRKNPNDLPDDTYDVLDQAGYKVHYNFFQNVWMTEKDEIECDVIAWQYLPEPPKEM